MKTGQVQIIDGKDLIRLIEDKIMLSSGIATIKALGDIYLDKLAAMQILEINNVNSLEHRVRKGKKDHVGICRKLKKHYPYGKNKPRFLLHEVYAYKMIK